MIRISLRTLQGYRTPILLIGLGLYAFALLLAYIFQAFGGAEGMMRYMEMMPESMQRIAEAEGFTSDTYMGYLAGGYRHPVFLISIAALFVLLNAEFLAVVQVLVYVGAISILIIFVIMLTKNIQDGNSSNNFTVPALAIAVVLFASMVFAFENTQWNDYESLGLNVSQAESSENASKTETGISRIFGNATMAIARLLLRDYVLPFEVASVLLLAAVVGALALVREKENES